MKEMNPGVFHYRGAKWIATDRDILKILYEYYLRNDLDNAFVEAVKCGRVMRAN